jgi:hypothetical protein
MNVLEILVKNEESIAELYRVYASRFNEYRIFWNRMAKEELGHAAIIRKCISEIDEGLIKLDAKRL